MNFIVNNKLFFLIILATTVICQNNGLFRADEEIPEWYDIYYKKADIAKGWKFIVIHHSATDAGDSETFHKFHSDQGYGGLCYHFLIGNGNGMPDGKIEESFRWKEQIAGTHVDINSWYHNIFGIGICLVGNFEKRLPTDKQMESLIRLIRRLVKEHNIPRSNILPHNGVPLGEIEWDNERITVKYKKNKFAPTLCSGKKFSIPSLIEKVFAKQPNRTGDND